MHRAGQRTERPPEARGGHGGALGHERAQLRRVHVAGQHGGYQGAAGGAQEVAVLQPVPPHLAPQVLGATEVVCPSNKASGDGHRLRW